MGKPKKGKKDAGVQEEVDDITEDVTSLTIGAEETLDAKSNKKKNKTKNKAKFLEVQDDLDKEDSDGDPPKHPNFKGQSAFNMLSVLGNEADMSGDDNDYDMPSADDDPNRNSHSKPNDGKQSAVDFDAPVAPKNKKKKDKKKKQAREEDDDLEALLANIEAPTERGKTQKKPKMPPVDNSEEDKADIQMANGEDVEAEGTGKKKKKREQEMTAEELAAMIESKATEKVLTIEDLENEYDDTSKKKKKKGKKDISKHDKPVIEKEGQGEGTEDVVADDGAVNEDGTEFKIKTAAQKKKDKKEREKKEKEADRGKKKKTKSKPADTDTTEKTADDEFQNGASSQIQTETQDPAEPEEEVSTKKKKKGKKEKGEKEKKPQNKQIAAIREHLRMLKEEEERLKREEEERQQKIEEARRQKEEEQRLAEEKRQLKRQREKEKIERQKREGTYLTAKQKAEKRRAEQMLELMKAQGMTMPDRTAPRKKPTYGTRRRTKPQSSIEESSEVVKGEDTALREPVSPSTDRLPSPGEEQEEQSGDDVKAAWDESDDEEKPSKESSPRIGSEQLEVKESVNDQQTTAAESETESEEDSSSEEEEESSSEEDSSSSEDDNVPLERAKEKIQKRHEEAEKKRSTDVLRAPVICVLGHVDTGKTKILDKLRRTNVQDGEAGGITQQIGATNVPQDAILSKTTMCTKFQKETLKLPGMLIIDTPGHESFSNLRTRGSSLCDIAVLVVDIMHGLEPQTIESINLLRKGKTPFVIALNKVDRLYEWKSSANTDVVTTIEKQANNTKLEFNSRVQQTIVEFAEQGLNVTLFHNNNDPLEYTSMVPTSAHTGDGMGNLLAQLCQLSQSVLANRLAYSEEVQATVMEVKTLPGLGTTIDVILVNGTIREGNTIVIAGTDGPIVSQIRGLLLPKPMKELRVKNQYDHCKEVNAAQGVKIIGKDFEKAMAGLPFYVAYDEDEVLFYKEELKRALEDVLGAIKLSDRGVFVQASTIGSLEALLEFLRTSKIPYAGINIGPVHKKDIMKASVMLEHDSQYAVILAFDVKIERDAQEMADTLGVRVFSADIIYHLFDQFMQYREDLKKSKQEEFRHVAVYPCKLRILPEFIFNSRDPIVAGVHIEAGTLKIGTPICVPSKEFIDLGRVSSIEINHKVIDTARKGQDVCIKIESSSNEAPKMYGRHFDQTDILVSKISRQSIDIMKNWFRDELQKSDWHLMVELKNKFEII